MLVVACYSIGLEQDQRLCVVIGSLLWAMLRASSDRHLSDLPTLWIFE